MILSRRRELVLTDFRITIYYVGEAPTLRMKGAKEMFEISINSRDNFVIIPVDEEIRMIMSPKTAV